MLVDQRKHIVHGIRPGMAIATYCGLSPQLFNRPQDACGFKYKPLPGNSIDCILCLAAS